MLNKFLTKVPRRNYGGPVIANTEHFIDLRSDTVTRPS